MFAKKIVKTLHFIFFESHKAPAAFLQTFDTKYTVQRLTLHVLLVIHQGRNGSFQPMYLREQNEDINRVSERDWFNKSEKRERWGGDQASICRERVRRHAFWQELKKTAVFGVEFLNASMLLQSPRLAWPIFSQGWPLFYFCHLWATQLLIHMQMKPAPSLACITASARCSVHSTRLS